MNDSISNVFKPFSKPDLLIFIAQVILLFVVVITSLVNLSIDNGNTNLWTMVLTSCLGYMMPNPRFKSNDTKESKMNIEMPNDGIVFRDLAVEHNKQQSQQQ